MTVFNNETMIEPEKALDELKRRYNLDPSAIGRLKKLLEVIANDPHAPTKLTDPKLAVNEHLADSLVALELGIFKQDSVVADLGSGVGFPGLALAAVLPNTRVFLVEARRRRCEFLGRAINAAQLDNATVVCKRIESWDDGISKFDVAVARALADLPVLLEYVAPLLKLGGSFVAWKGRRDPTEERSGMKAANQLGMNIVEVRNVKPFEQAHHRHLYWYNKQDQTPSNFPRRPGMARKRPLA